MGRERKPSGLPQERITGSPFAGIDDHITGFRDPNPTGVRRVRNVFIAVAAVTSLLALWLLGTGDIDAAGGVAFILVLPVVVLALIAQLVLWNVESTR